MYATLFSYVESHHKDLIVAERKLKEDVEHHGHGHGGHAEHDHGQKWEKTAKNNEEESIEGSF